MLVFFLSVSAPLSLSILLLLVVAMYQSSLIYLFKMWHNRKTNWIHAKSIMYAVSVVGCLQANKRLDSVDVYLLMIEKANTFLTMSKANDEWKWKKAYPYVQFISLMFMVQRFTLKQWIGTHTKKKYRVSYTRHTISIPLLWINMPELWHLPNKYDFDVPEKSHIHIHLVTHSSSNRKITCSLRSVFFYTFFLCFYVCVMLAKSSVRKAKKKVTKIDIH